MKKHLDSHCPTWRAAGSTALPPPGSGWLSKQAASSKQALRCTCRCRAECRIRTSERALPDQLTTHTSLSAPGYGAVSARIITQSFLAHANLAIFYHSDDDCDLHSPLYTPSAASRTALHPRDSQTEDAIHAMRNAPADPRSSLHIILPMRIVHTVDIQPTGSTALWRILELT